MGRKDVRYIVDAKGRRTEVIVPIEKYRRLLEDLHDLAVVAERSGEGRVAQ